MLLATLLLGSFAGSAQAQEATLFGQIRAPGGAPVPYVNLYLEGSERGAASDSLGRYSLEVPAGDTLRLRFTYLASRSVTKRIAPLAPGERRRFDLTYDPSIALKEFELERSTQRTRTMVDKVDVKNITQMPNTAGGVEGLIKLLPGVQSGNELSSAYSVRGGNYDENLVYINGIEIYRPFLARAGQQEGLSIINPDLVQDINFSAGGFEARYGDKLSSVLDITYREPTEFGGSFDASLLGAQAHVHGTSDDYRFNYLIGARYRSNQYLLNSTDIDADYQPIFADVQSFMTYDLTSNLQLEWLSYYGRNRFQQQPLSQNTRFGTVTQAFQLRVFYEGQELTTAETFLNGLTLRQRIGEATELRYSLSHFNTYETESFDVIGAYRIFRLESDLGSEQFGEPTEELGIGAFHNHARNVLDANIFGLQHNGSHRWGPGHRLRWGARYRRELIDDRLREWELVDSAGFSLPRTPADELRLDQRFRGNVDLATDRLTAYAQNGWLLAPRANGYLTAGLRGHWWSYNQEYVVSPRLSYSFEPNFAHNREIVRRGLADSLRRADLQLKLAAGMYHQPPFYREIREIDGSLASGVEAQRSFHGVAGLVWRFEMWNRAFRWKAEAYYKRMWNLIPYDLENIRIRYRPNEQAEGFAYGADMQLYGELVEGLPSWITLSVLQVKEDIRNDTFRVSGENGQSRVREQGYLPRPTERVFSGSFYIQDHLPDNPLWRLHMRLNYATGLPFGPPNNDRYRNAARMPAYRRFDMGVSKEISGDPQARSRGLRWFRSLWIRAEVFNILAIRNTISYNWLRDTEGRQFAVPNLLTSRRFNLSLRVEL